MAESDDIFKDFGKYKKEGEKEGKKMDEKEIVIKIKPRMLERAVYWIVILALIVLVIFNPLSKIKFGLSTTVESGETVQAGDAVISDVEKNETKEETPAKEETKEEEQTSQEEQTQTLSGKITMVITSITTEKDDDGNPTKVKEVKFSIDNQKEDFRPNIKIYFYDDSDMDEVKENVRAEATFPTLIAGTSKDYKITKFKSKYVTDYHDGEKVYVKIYNANTKKLVIEKSKEIE